MPSNIDNILIQVRSKLQDNGIKLWLEPYYFEDIGPIESELDRLAEDFSQILAIPVEHCRLALSELQDGALTKLQSRKEFERTGEATFKGRVVRTGNQNNDSVSVLNLKCPLTDLGKQFYENVAKELNVNENQIKIICSGKVIQRESTLMAQGLSNNQQIMILIGTDNGSNSQPSIYERVQKAKDDAQLILASKDQSFLTMEDQDGNAVHLPPNERDAIILALALYEKGRSAMKREQYDEALVLYLEADEQFSACNSQILETVDNYALLNLDIVWCYLCLKSFSYLPDAQKRLTICEQNFRRSYGPNMDRLLQLKPDSAGNEQALIVRLHLLQGVLFFHQNRRNEAYDKLLIAETELRRLKIDEEKLTNLMEMGYSVLEARIGLRACNNNIEAAINHITDRREKKKEARKKGKKEFEMNRKLKGFHGDEWINPKSVTTLVDMGFAPEIAAAALKRAENDLTRAVDLLQNNQQELISDLPKKSKPSTDLIDQLMKIGFDSEMVKMALETSFNNPDQAIDLLLKMQNEGNYQELLESLNQIQNDLIKKDGACGSSSSDNSNQAGPSNKGPLPKLLTDVKDKIRKEMETKKAFDRFSEDVSTEEDEYLDLPLVQEENILLEYKNYLDQ